MKPTLLVLAAGMGSRYGGLKQVDPVGPSGETIIDYSIHDALGAGFGRVVFVIRREIEKAFREMVGQRFEKKADVSYAFQELDRVPSGFKVPSKRTKPWGTGHAILIAESEVHESFAVINGDDFYGPSSFRSLADYLKAVRDSEAAEYSMVGFVLRKTLSEFGSVSRGVCETDSQGFLRNVVERTKIEKAGAGAKYTDERGEKHSFSGDELVSMNLWGFTPSIFEHLKRQFDEFLRAKGDEEKSEFYIPTVVNQLVAEGRARVKVLPTPEQWFGVTYQEDRPHVSEGIRKLVDAGIYPGQLK